MKEYYTVGETARLNNITNQTLRYYDKIGIFKPEYTDSKNGYRYYHIRQFFYLDIIKYLKQIRTPLEEIKSIIKCDPEHMQAFIEEQENVITQEIRNLEKARRLLYRRKNQLKEQLDICSKKIESVYFRYIEEQPIIKVETPQLNGFEQSDIYFRRLADVLEERGDIVDSYYGYIYDFASYNNPSEILTKSIYTAICIEEEIELGAMDISSDMIPQGEYVCISFDWSTDNFYSYYCKLFSFIELNGIQTDGHVYQVSLPTNYSSLRKEQFLTEIRVRKV
ncbi:MerR family transcriptional regulator [Niallia circulans]|uniref:MerR family transcriptional regulator n=1 Tax=Niallia circulans TaxID=1397 RepID=A0A553SUJ9_NIACI|nr:MerR family transcriptional regulator [Niallia circulans]TRZ40670.1 MerR family transcriptional regulator [Niallia circulans]